jgi:hypothetical protein
MNENIDKSKIVITSIFYGFIIPVLIFFLGHLSNSDRTFMTDSNSFGYYTGASKVLWGSYKCVFGDRHQINTDGASVYDFGNQKLSINQAFGDAFSHFSTIAIIGFILTILISIVWMFNADKNKFKEIN